MEKYQAGKQNQRICLLLAVLAMFLIVVSLLLSSFQIAVYGDPKYRFYEKEYVKYEVTEALDMKLSDVMAVTEYMMDYLIGRKEELSIETDVDGKRQDFFNEQDRLHMADVKGLFLGGLKLRTMLLLGAALLIGILAALKARLWEILPKAYIIAIAFFAAALVFLGIVVSIDFTRCFRIFHEIFFDNDLWMFNPGEDYMIRMLPEGFFADMVVRIVSVFVAGLVLLGGVIGLAWFFYRKKQYKIYDKHTACKKNMI